MFKEKQDCKEKRIKRSWHTLHIGMRKIKSLLAIVIAFCIWQPIRIVFPDLEVHPLFIYVYALIEIRDASEKTVNFGKERIKASLIALTIGLATVALCNAVKMYLAKDSLYTIVELIGILLGVLLTLSLTEKAGCKTFCGFAAAVFIILMVLHANDERYLYAFLRAAQTMIGVFVAMIINVWLFPYPPKSKKVEASQEHGDGTESQSDF